jgi:hypothetical protein
MSQTIDPLVVRQYTDAVNAGLQQFDVKIANKFHQGTYSGEKAAISDTLDASEMKPVSSQLAKITYDDQAYTRRWILPQIFTKSYVVGSFEKLLAAANPESELVKNIRAAAARQMDIIAINAMFGTGSSVDPWNYTGIHGTTNEIWDTTHSGKIVPVGATSLTTAKLKTAKKLLLQQEVDFDMEEVFCVVTPQQWADIFDDEKLINFNYNDGRPLMDGVLRRYMGFNFIISNKLLLRNGVSKNRSIPVFSASGMEFGTWGALNLNIYQDMTIEGQPWAVHAYGSWGSARREPKKLIEITCLEP